MSEFARRLPHIDRLQGLLTDDEAPWWRDLLAQWRPAGSSSGDAGLRLAIRNRSMNFYRLGQSVAKVCFGRGAEPCLEVHVAYATGRRGTGSHYARLIGKELVCSGYPGDLEGYDGPATLRRWTHQAETRSVREKEFVDQVLAANPDVIDLEMGLPAYIRPDDGRQVAPRMDIVALERAGQGPRLAFWEAKLMANGELRRRDTAAPSVVRQLRDYEDWLRNGQETRVASAYSDNCRLLVALHDMARSVHPQIPELGPLIRQVASVASPPALDPRPRLLISDPTGWSGWTALHSQKLNSYRVQLVKGTTLAGLKLQGPATEGGV